MKKKLLLIVAVLTLCISTLAGCQSATRSLGGNMTIQLEPNQKLELITWKDDSLWYCTRPMRENEEPETHIYQESSQWGILEGTVTIMEVKTLNEND